MTVVLNACRYASHVDIADSDRTIRLHKRRKREANDLWLVGADHQTVTDSRGTKPIELFEPSDCGMSVTRTQFEADLIALARPGVRPPIAIERLYPWLPSQSYLESSVANFHELRGLHRRYGKHLISPREYCDLRWATICNKLRRISVLDSTFYSAWHLPLQRAYALSETRQDRTVVALDFNSMYGWCMQHQFPDPRHLRRVCIQRELVDGETLAPGIYKCRITGPYSVFLQKYNPFQVFFAGRYLGADLEEGVEAFLNEFEIPFYLRHAKHVYAIEGIVSDAVIDHPLAAEARRLFAIRKRYAKQGNAPLANQAKLHITWLASCSSRPSRHVFGNFENPTSLLSALQEKLGIRPFVGEPRSSFAAWLSRDRNIRISRPAGRWRCVGTSLDDGSACFSLGQRIVAAGRDAMLRMMERLHALGDCEVAYCNIDSIHVSLPTAKLGKFDELLAPYICQDMGGLKVEAICAHGLWLEPGRYWLYDGAVRKFRNRVTKDRTDAFRSKVIGIVGRSVDGLWVPSRVGCSMARSLSDAAEVVWNESAGVSHQRLVEISSAMTHDDVLEKLIRNQERAIPEKLRALEQLRLSMS